jgi:glucuronokinase
MIKSKSYPRVAIAGNPSDGFWGKCVSFAFKNYKAEVIIKEEDEKRENNNILVNPKNLKEIKNPAYKDTQLLIAALSSFFLFCELNKIKIDKRKFLIDYQSNIPYRVGFSGSAAISIATLKAINQFYNTKLTESEIERIALHAETGIIGRSAGPQDPVTVSREVALHMDFTKEAYQRKEKNKLVKLAIVHRDFSSTKAYLHKDTPDPLITKLEINQEMPFFIISGGEGSDSSIANSINVKAYKENNKFVIEGMEKISKLADCAKEAIIAQNEKDLGKIIKENFLLSLKYFDRSYLGEGNIELVNRAINIGACAKFPGSGGAVFGMYFGEKMFQKLKERFRKYTVEKVRPC